MNLESDGGHTKSGTGLLIQTKPSQRTAAKFADGESDTQN